MLNDTINGTNEKHVQFLIFKVKALIWTFISRNAEYIYSTIMETFPYQGKNYCCWCCFLDWHFQFWVEFCVHKFSRVSSYALAHVSASNAAVVGSFGSAFAPTTTTDSGQIHSLQCTVWQTHCTVLLLLPLSLSLSSTVQFADCAENERKNGAGRENGKLKLETTWNYVVYVWLKEEEDTTAILSSDVNKMTYSWTVHSTVEFFHSLFSSLHS